MLKVFIFLIVIKFNLSNKDLGLNKISKNNVNSSVIIQNYTKSNSLKKNVILGIISKYTWKRVAPFFKSLLKAKLKNCDIVMFVRDVSKLLINNLKNIGVNVHIIPEKYKNISTINCRWKMYIDFLKNKKNVYNLVFSADTRDTIFQKDVFNYYQNHSSFLGIAIEDGTLNSPINKKWIINFCGKELFETIMTERIICIGSLWGTLDKFLEFSIVFWKKLFKNPNAIEQGIANFLFYHEKLFQDYLIKSDNYGPVMTIGITRRENIHLDSENNILNFRGEIASVVHQYDRKHDIASTVINKFCPELIETNKTNIQNDKIILAKKLEKFKMSKKSNLINFIFLNIFFSFILLIKNFLNILKKRII